jgi:hypothetical protein
MSKQIIFGTPSADWCAVDNSSAPTYPTLSNSTSLGYDTTAPGATSQASNPFGDTGSTTLDINGNDVATPDPSVGTVVGNPVSGTQPTYKTVTKVINSALTGISIAFKNPA